jgi:signal transduction histidine kinase
VKKLAIGLLFWAFMSRALLGSHQSFDQDSGYDQADTTLKGVKVVPKKRSTKKIVKTRVINIGDEQDEVDDAPVQPYSKNLFIPEFDEKAYIAQQRKAVIALVDRGEAYLKNHSESESFNAFNYNKKFLDGDIFLFVYSLDGVCLANGDDSWWLWQNMYNFRDSFGTFIVRVLIEKAQEGGGWITYHWYHATKVSYVKKVIKNGVAYVIGAGYFPHSKRDATVSLVRSAAEYFRDRIKSGGSPDEAFSKFSYPLGVFVLGDLYLYALDFDGNIVAQGDRPGLIGQNMLDYQDADGHYTNREIIEKLKKSSNSGIWTGYTSKRAPKITYAEKVTDSNGKNYFIACGYFPDADRAQAVDLVRRGFKYMEGHGKLQAAAEINSKTNDDFRYGELSLVVYDIHGICVGNGGNSDAVGTNQYDTQDEDGKYYVRDMIQKAKNGGGWLDFRLKNAFYFVYVEKVKLGLDEYVITTGLYPISKPETMQLLVKGAVGFIESTKKEVAFAELVKKNGSFVHGDLEIFVIDERGICYANGDHTDDIWRDMLALRDDNGKEYIRDFIRTAKHGAGRVSFKKGGKTKYAYVEPLKKDGVFYAVCSSFYK